MSDKLIPTNHHMLTLEDTHASQKNLNQLCADRPLRTPEIFQPNAFYGNDLILKMYAARSPTYRLKFVVPHGISTSEDFIWESEVDAVLPAILCYSYHREAPNSRSGKCLMYSAYPFVYLVEMLKSQPKPERRGTIFFPAHSTHYVTAQMDFEAVAEELTCLGHEYQPVTVCIYWRDFNLGHHLPFQQRGFPIVSAGHIYDNAFLFRFYHLCSIHRYAASNELGSQLFYSVKSGCSYFHLDKFKTTHVADDHILKRDSAPIPPAREAALKSLFSTPCPSTTAEQMKMVDYYLGTDYFKTPQDLRRQLLYAEVLDKFGLFLHNRGRGVRFVIPTYYRRNANNQLANLSRLKRKVTRLCRTTSCKGTDK